MTRGSKSPGQEPLSCLPLKPQAGRGGGTHVCTPTWGRARSPLVRPRAMQQEGSHRWGKSTHCDLPTVSGRQLGVEPRTWPPEDGSAPLQNQVPVLRRVNQEPGFLSWFCWFLSGPQSVWTARTTVLKGFFFFLYLFIWLHRVSVAALRTSVASRGVFCCGSDSFVWLTPEHTGSVVASYGLSCSAACGILVP